jgi:hypothetical protein
MARSNFAVSWEGRRPSAEVGPDFSLSSERTSLSEILTQEDEAAFGSRQNILDVVHDILSGVRPNDGLLYSAASALQRRDTRSGEGSEQWINRLSGTFFADLSDKS